MVFRKRHLGTKKQIKKRRRVPKVLQYIKRWYKTVWLGCSDFSLQGNLQSHPRCFSEGQTHSLISFKKLNCGEAAASNDLSKVHADV